MPSPSLVVLREQKGLRSQTAFHHFCVRLFLSLNRVAHADARGYHYDLGKGVANKGQHIYSVVCDRQRIVGVIRHE